jgi:iron(III) transport system permease protein
MAFLPYLLPSLSVGAAYFVFGSQLGLWNSFFLLILVGTIKYIPFASRASQSAMMQISGEIEESADHRGHSLVEANDQDHHADPEELDPLGLPPPLHHLDAGMDLVHDALRRWNRIVTTLLGYFDEMNLYGLSNGINLIIIVVISCRQFLDEYSHGRIARQRHWREIVMPKIVLGTHLQTLRRLLCRR